ncbi:hypothetical protein AC249_AIPGENE17837 [Exaiptasia diaphana]|nr:hypothetical protein AC249_AIPGENE17837 [Exaiptasia diaphana]
MNAATTQMSRYLGHSVWQEFKKTKGHDKLDYSASEMNRELLELATQEGDSEEWHRKFKIMSKLLAGKMVNQENPDKNNEQYTNQSISELQGAARKNKLITAVRTKLTAFSGPLSSRAKDSLSSLDAKWYDLSDDTKQGAIDTLGVISSNIEVFGNAGEDPIGAIRGAIDMVASITINFEPKGQLASVAQGFVSAVLGLFGKGPKPKPLGQVVREQIDEALEQYREKELVRRKDGTTERVQRILQQHNIKCCIKPDKTLRQILSKPKDPVEYEKQSGVVYRIPCGECSTQYIGETGRALRTRRKEHEAAVRLGKTSSSALVEHASKTGHAINWKETSILCKESRWSQRRWSEAIEIAKKKNVLFNRDKGRMIPQNYLCVIRS